MPLTISPIQSIGSLYDCTDDVYVKCKITKGGKLCLTLVDSKSNGVKRSFTINCPGGVVYDGCVILSKSVLLYSRESGYFVNQSQTLYSDDTTFTFSIKLKKSQKILSVVKARDRDNILFVTCTGEQQSIRAIKIFNSSAKELISKISVEISANSHWNSLYSHPTKPLLFTASQSGLMNIYDYSNAIHQFDSTNSTLHVADENTGEVDKVVSSNSKSLFNHIGHLAPPPIPSHHHNFRHSFKVSDCSINSILIAVTYSEVVTCVYKSSISNDIRREGTRIPVAFSPLATFTGTPNGFFIKKTFLPAKNSYSFIQIYSCHEARSQTDQKPEETKSSYFDRSKTAPKVLKTKPAIESFQFRNLREAGLLNKDPGSLLIISIHNLLEATLTALGSYVFQLDPTFTSICNATEIQDSGDFRLSVFNSQLRMYYSIEAFLSPLWKAAYNHSPMIYSSINTVSELVYAVNTKTIAELLDGQLKGPLLYSYNVCSLQIHSSDGTQNPNDTATVICNIPNNLSKLRGLECDVFAGDDSIYIPSRFMFATSILKVLFGTLISPRLKHNVSMAEIKPVTDDTYAFHADRMRAVCIIETLGSATDYFYSICRAASVKQIVIDGVTSTSILLLSKNGLQVHQVSLPINRNDISSNLKRLHTLPESVSQLWCSPIVTGPNWYLIYSTGVDQFESDIYCHKESDSSSSGFLSFVKRDRIIITAPNEISFSKIDTTLTLEPNEVVLDVVWQRLDPAHPPVVGMLTTSRILLLSLNLDILNSDTYRPDDPISSVYFSSHSLIYVTSRGLVKFLIPLPTFISMNTFTEFQNEICSFLESFIISDSTYSSKSLYQGSILSVPHQLNRRSTLQIVSTHRHDCIFFAYVGDDSSLCIVTRPAQLAEMLLCGLLSLLLHSMEKQCGDFSAWRRDFQHNLHRYYVESNISRDTMASPTTHQTNRAYAALFSIVKMENVWKTGASEKELDVIKNCILLATGYSKVSTFSKRRWIQNSSLITASRALISNDSSRDDAMQFFNSTRPDLSDIIREPSLYGESSLLRIRSALGRQSSAAARVFMQQGKLEVAKILGEFGGETRTVLLIALYESVASAFLCSTNDISRSKAADYVEISWNEVKLRPHKIYLTSLLSQHTQLEGKLKSVCIETLNALLSYLECLDYSTTASTQLEFKQKVLNESASYMFTRWLDLMDEDEVIRTVTSSTIGTEQPRLALQQSLPPTADSVRPKLADLELQKFAFNSLEELLCLRATPELTVSRHEHRTDAQNHVANDILKPRTWVEDVGKGKEWEKVVAYYRFTDPIYSGANFHSTGLPPCRLCFNSLSKFHLPPLEVFCTHANPHSILFEPSSSPCVAEEGHDKIKSLYDVIFTSTYAELKEDIEIGLRTVVGRGTPLDLLFHSKSYEDRNKQTIELWTKYDISSVSIITNSISTPANQSDHVLIERVIGGPPSRLGESILSDKTNLNGSPMWRLFVDQHGYVGFSFFHQQSQKVKNLKYTSVKIRSHELFMCTLKTHEPVFSFSASTSDHENTNLNSWTHVALVIDGTLSNADSTMQCCIYINGTPQANGQLDLPSIDEAHLTVTTLYAGLNLTAGWHLTELRFFADTRNTDQIDVTKESFLPLARKRSRVNYGLKNTKELFNMPDIKPVLKDAATILTPLDILFGLRVDKNENEVKLDFTPSVIANLPLAPNSKPNKKISIPNASIISADVRADHGASLTTALGDSSSDSSPLALPQPAPNSFLDKSAAEPLSKKTPAVLASKPPTLESANAILPPSLDKRVSDAAAKRLAMKAKIERKNLT